MKRAALLLSVCCLLLGGCVQRTPPVIKIGLIAPFEGRHRAQGYEVLYAVKEVVRQRNQAGGVVGYLIELVALNDDGDASRAAFQAQKLDIDEDVMGVVGPFAHDTLAATAPLYAEGRLPGVSPAMCPDEVGSGLFCSGANAAQLAQALIDRLPPDAWIALLRAQEGPLGKHLQVKAQRVVTAPWDAQELVWRLDKSRARPPSLYLYEGDAVTAVDLLVEMEAIGVEVPFWGGPALARAQLPQLVGDAVSKVCYVMPAPLLADLAPGSAFADGYRQLAGTAPGPWAALAYDATTLLLDALDRAIQADGRPSRQGVLDQLTHASSPITEPVFIQGQRQAPEIVMYCYDEKEGYPGHILAK